MGINAEYMGTAPTPPPAPTPTPPPPPPPPAPTSTPAPAPPAPSIHGIQNFGHACLQAEHQTPANGQAVTVEYCNGSEQQDWNFDYDRNAITYKDFCMDATDMATGTNLIIWECNGQVQQHWDVEVQMQYSHDW